MFSKVLLILYLTSVAFATVFVTSPTAQSVFQAGQNATIAWQDDGSAPSLAAFGLASIAIYVGNAISQTSLQVITSSVNVSNTSSVSFVPQANIGPNGNDYFIRFHSLTLLDNSLSETTSLAFSAKFTLAGMSGTFSAAVQSEIAGQSTAPIGGQTSASIAVSTSVPSTTTNPTTTSSHVPSATKSASGAVGIKVGWIGAALGALIGVASF